MAENLESSPAVEPLAPAAQPTSANEHSRVGTVWLGLVVAVILLIILVVFILENMQKVRISFLGLHGNVPVALGLLIAAIAGALLTLIIGSIRILQLRSKRHHLAH